MYPVQFDRIKVPVCKTRAILLNVLLSIARYVCFYSSVYDDGSLLREVLQAHLRRWTKTAFDTEYSD